MRQFGSCGLRNQRSGSGGRVQAEFAHGDLQVGPGFFFLARIAEQKCRMIGDDELAAAPGVDTSAKAGEGLALAEEIRGRCRAERDDDLRANDVDLAEEEWRAGVGLVGLRGAIAGGTALDDVGDVDLVAPEAHGDDHVIEKLAGLADEGNALRVFVSAGAFAYEQEAGVGRAVGKDDFVAAFVEGATGAVADVIADELEGGGSVGGLDDCGHLGRSEDGLAGGDGGGLLGNI